MQGLWRDVMWAGRSLAKARAFTFVCVVSLGIGMAPVIAVPYASRMLTTPPPGLNTAGLVELVTTPQGPRRATPLWSYPDFTAIRDADTGLSLVGWAPAEIDISLEASPGDKRRALALFVTSNYFATVGVALAQGTGFPGAPDPVVILSHEFWQRRLGSAANAIGRLLTVNGVPHAVVGVAPVSFSGHLAFQEPDVFVPLERHPRVIADASVRFDRATEWVNIHARLSPGVDIAQARGAVMAITAQLANDHPATNAQKPGTVAPYHPIGSLQAPEFAVFTAIVQTLTLLPLLVVAVNIAGMMQVRGAMRERELAIRQAIGASRRQLMQQLLAESVVLAALGATLASVVLFNAAPLAAWWVGEPLPAHVTAALRVDVPMLAIVAGLCLATSLVFGWLPAARFSRPVIVTVLKDETGAGGGVRVGRVHRVAAALQVAIATPLLVLGVMTLDRMRATATGHLGFEAETLYAAPLTLPADDSGDAEFAVRSAVALLAKAGGVASVTVADGLPLDFRYRITRIATVEDENAAPKVIAAHVTRVGDRYLDTMGIPLLAGRPFGVDDRLGAEPVAILSKPLADRLFAGADPVGQRVTFDAGATTARTLTIVGVTADFPTSQMSTNRAQLLVPLAQYPNVVRDSVRVDDDRSGVARLMLVLRREPGAEPKAATAALERVLRNFDPEFAPATIVTGVSLREFSTRDFLTQSAVAGTVGGVLLLLAALGIYGVVGLLVTTRRREIAVRVALGASRRRVMGLVLFEVVKLVLPGVGIGLLLAVAFVRLNGEDFGIPLSALEPLAYVIGATLAVLVAITAGVLPAHRAASVPPMAAMRSE
jgi:predicted permease